jgi:hypothetical protein
MGAAQILAEMSKGASEKNVLNLMSI